MITTTEDRSHPVIAALSAAHTAQGGLNEAVEAAVDRMLSDARCTDWVLLWDYQDDRFVLEPVFGRTIYLSLFFTSYLSRAAKAARASGDRDELIKLQIKAVKGRLKRDRLDLMKRHVFHEALPGVWLPYHTGYFEPEWLLKQKLGHIFLRDDTFQHLLTVGAVQQAAGRSLLNDDAPELTGNHVFAELVTRFSEEILDPLWEKRDVERHSRLSLHYYAHRFGDVVLDKLCSEAIAQSKLTGFSHLTGELALLIKIGDLLEDLQIDHPTSEGLKELLTRFELLELWGSRARDKERYPKLGKDISAEVERIRQLA